jgi:outer membrane protein OmpA-like peptidoglycan-associated protein
MFERDHFRAIRIASPAAEDFPMRHLIASLVVAPILFGALPGYAQSNPTAEQIIDALKPNGNLQSGGTRGIRLSSPSGQATTPGQATASGPGVRTATTQPMAMPQPSAYGRSINLTVEFATDSAQLTSQAMAALDQLGRALSNRELSAYRFRIEGHTDTVGSTDYNRTLSEQRADAVVTYLATKFGVASSRLQAVGMGEEGLLVPTPPQTPELRNRRVQIINLGA